MKEKLKDNFWDGDSFSRQIEKQVGSAFRASQKEVSQAVGKSFKEATKGLGSIFKEVSGQGIKGGIKSASSVLKSFLGKDNSSSLGGSALFSWAPVIGSVVSGLGSLFEGIVSLWGGVSASRQGEIDKAYQAHVDALNRTFEREIQVRSENIEELNNKLSAFTKAFSLGQMTAEDYHRASTGIKSQIKREELEKARAKKIQELMTSEAGKKKQYDEESAKWFPDHAKLSSLQGEINRLQDRQYRTQQASVIAEVNMAKDGALQRVSRPTLFMAGEAGAEIVSVRPLKAGIDPSLERMGKGSFTQIFNIQVSGFVGDETALGAKLTQVIQETIRTRGEKEYRR